MAPKRSVQPKVAAPKAPKRPPKKAPSKSQPKPPASAAQKKPVKPKKRDDRPLTKREEKRVVKFRMELEGIIEDMRKESEIYGSLLQDLVPVRNRLEELTDIIRSDQTVKELREASRNIRENEPDVWKELFKDVYPDPPDSPSPPPTPNTTSGGKKRKAEDKEFKAPSQTPSKKSRSASPTVTAASTRSLRKK